MAYFTPEELRETWTELGDEDKYPDVRVADKIAQAEETIEDACDVAFIVRERTFEVAAADALGDLALPNNRIRGVTELAGAVSGDLDAGTARIVAGGYLRRTGGWPANETITVTYTHGYDEPPRRILAAAMLYARELIIKGPIDSRKTQLPTAEGGVINLLTPGQRGSITGIPEVDAAIAQHREFG